MSSEPKDYQKVTMQNGRRTPAAHVVVPGSLLQEAFENCLLGELDPERPVVCKRIMLKSHNRCARVVLEFTYTDQLRENGLFKECCPYCGSVDLEETDPMRCNECNKSWPKGSLAIHIKRRNP